MDNSAWTAYCSEVEVFDMDDFVSNGQPIVDQDMSAYPSPSLGTGLVEGHDDQYSGNDSQGRHALQETDNINSSPSVPTPHPQTPANSSPKVQTIQSSKRGRVIGASGHRFACDLCSFSSNTKRDYTRHVGTRKHQKNSGIAKMMGFHCPVPECKYSATGETFTREDNLWRHIRMTHNIKKQV